MQVMTAPQLAIRFGKSKAVVAVNGLRQASEYWQQYRDANFLVSSESPLVTVVDTASGKTVARISYNGRVWNPDGSEVAI